MSIQELFHFGSVYTMSSHIGRARVNSGIVIRVWVISHAFFMGEDLEITIVQG